MSVALALSAAIDFAHADVPGLHRQIDSTRVHGPLVPLVYPLAAVWETEAGARGLSLGPELKRGLNTSATLHKARRSFSRQRVKLSRPNQHDHGNIRIQRQVKQRCLADSSYRPDNRVSTIDNRTWPAQLQR